MSEDVQFAFELNGQVYMPKEMSGIVLAHEIGHVLGVKDIYVDNRLSFLPFQLPLGYSIMVTS